MYIFFNLCGIYYMIAYGTLIYVFASPVPLLLLFDIQVCLHYQLAFCKQTSMRKPCNLWSFKMPHCKVKPLARFRHAARLLSLWKSIYIQITFQRQLTGGEEMISHHLIACLKSINVAPLRRNWLYCPQLWDGCSVFPIIWIRCIQWCYWTS